MTRPTRFAGYTFPAAGFAATKGGNIDIGSNANTVVIVRGGENEVTPDTLVGCTLNGLAMTALTAGTRSGGGDIQTYIIDSAAAIGSGSVPILLTASDGNSRLGLCVEVWHDCGGSPRYEALAAATKSSSASPSHTVTADADSSVVLMSSVSSGIVPTATAPTTLGANSSTGSNVADFALVKDGAASTTLNWAYNFADATYVQPIKLNGVPGGGAPTLTAPTGAATGNTTANAGATIDAVSGSGLRIMYALARIGGSAASSATIISTGTQLAITSAGARSVPLTGLTPGASYSADVVYVDATTGTSNVVTGTWTQPTAAVLSSPTNTPGSTTALIGATTTVSSGTAYFLARVGGSAASAATIITTGQTSPVTTTTPSRTVTGLTASTANNYVDIVQVSGVTTSNVVSTAAFTTTASGDTTVPTLGGSIIIGTVTDSSIQTSLSQAGADNVGVTSYEVSSNSGGSWLDVGIPGSLSYTFPGLSASTSYPLWWRAKDAAGNVSAALTATQSTAAASGVGSINLNSAIYTFKTNNGTSLVSMPVTFYVNDVSTGALIGSAITGLSTNASALVTTAISNASMLAGTTYCLRWKFSSGEYGMAELPAV